MFSFFTQCKTRRPITQRSRRPSYRPILEALEDRCLPNAGYFDPTFGSGGTVTTALTTLGDYAHGVLLQPNGDIIAYGEASTGKKSTPPAEASASFGLARYTPNGSPDTTFGNNGVVVTSNVGRKNVTGGDPGGKESGVTQAALESDGKIVAVGNGSYLIRYNSNGSFDTTFGAGGVVTVPTGFSAESVLIQPSNGDILVGGTYNSDVALLRYTPAGTLDSTFGNNGEVVTSAAAGSVASLALENGDIVAGGNGFLARYTLSGSLDASFGSGGIISSPVEITSLLVQPDGRIVAVGNESNWALARYNINGSLDSSFGSGGMVTSSINGGDRADGSALQSNGQIVVVGFSLNTLHFEVGVYNPNGSVDTSFGSGGFITQSNVFVATNGTFVIGDIGSGVVIQSDGKIVTATSTDYRNNAGDDVAGFMVARYGPSAAQIDSFTANPNPVTAGSSVTLAASNITLADPSSTIIQVAFYLDSNNDSSLESTGTNPDTLLGYAMFSNGVWTFTFSTSVMGLTAGTYTLFAQAEDSDGIFSDPAALTLTVQ